MQILQSSRLTSGRHAACNFTRKQNVPQPRYQNFQCRAAKDAGKLLRDAMQQPKQGTNLTLLAAGNYLRSLGIENSPDITRILDILTNKNSLFGTKGGKTPINPYARKITVDEMQAVVEFFGTKGFASEAIVGIILEFPQVLSYSIPERLDPFFNYLVTEVGLSAEQVAGVVKRRPVLLGLDQEALERLVGYLVETNGSSMEEVIGLLETSL